MTGVLAVSLAVFSFIQSKPPTICIDPGHPSEVGIGTRGKIYREVDVNWKVATYLKGKLISGGYHVVLTKANVGQKVLNKRRAEIANGSKASLMLRLHCDAASGSGFAIYYPAKQGRSQGKSGPSATVIAASKLAAQSVHLGMAGHLKGVLSDRGIKTDRDTAVGKKQGALTGLIFSKVPVVLVEMVVLTNPADERFLNSDNGFEELAEGLVDFHEPINVGELVSMVGSVTFVGKTSLEVTIEVFAENLLEGRKRHTNTARVTTVAIKDGKPFGVPRLVCETREDRLRFLEGQLRREFRRNQLEVFEGMAAELRQKSDAELDSMMPSDLPRKS